MKPKLKICLGAVVQRLDIDEDNRIQGVYVETEQPSGKTFYIKAKQVILCGGAVASPQLLMLRYLDFNHILIVVASVRKRNCPRTESSANSILQALAPNLYIQ
jgi:choline dehydrogenase-like flavoprotein